MNQVYLYAGGVTKDAKGSGLNPFMNQVYLYGRAVADGRTDVLTVLIPL